jgi:hypothetical protein
MPYKCHILLLQITNNRVAKSKLLEELNVPNSEEDAVRVPGWAMLQVRAKLLAGVFVELNKMFAEQRKNLAAGFGPLPLTPPVPGAEAIAQISEVLKCPSQWGTTGHRRKRQRRSQAWDGVGLCDSTRLTLR